MALPYRFFPHSLARALRLALAALVLSALAACGSSVTLYSSASEGEANELLSVLLDAGIHAEKVSGKEGVAVQSSFFDGVAFYQITEKGLMAHADVSGTKFWVNDELR